ncbi:MAG: hypothetical protein H6985_03540 [Pseudomonadales bacterium]|nr:hypothetical protein [Halioglobus sp.]MCP5128639.1 hypothetical protein [Pseudomonadales bacterium]
MTQHEYIFVAVSIILGLAITRLLHAVALLIRAHRQVTFHWATALWGLSILAYSLQLWWVGWGLRDVEAWTFFDFLVLIFGSTCIYGAAEMALPVPEAGSLDFLLHSERLGRLSALSMLIYFAIGPYVNLTMMTQPPPLPLALAVPGIGIAITGLIILVPRWFSALSVTFALYSVFVIYITA